MYKFVVIVVMILINTASNAQDMVALSYNDFSGYIAGKYKVTMTLFPHDDGVVYGYYMYDKYEKKINISGEYDGRRLVLTELDEHGGEIAKFDGQVSVVQDDFAFSGTWSDFGGKKNLPFLLVMKSVVFGEWGNRYSDIGAPNDEVIEDFVQAVKNSILKNDYRWLSNNVTYPISVLVDGERRVIKSVDEFMSIADKIFCSEFKDAVAKYVTKILFVNSDGVMFGDGEIWVNYVLVGDNDFELKITEINNK